MQWSTCNSNNENGLLKSNSPHRLRTTHSSFTGVQRPQIIESAKSITIGEVKIYGAAATERGGIEKKDQVDTK